MRLLPSALAMANLTFAVLIFAVGGTGMLAAYDRLPITFDLDALTSGGQITASERAYTLDRLAKLEGISPQAHRDRALALMAPPSASPRQDAKLAIFEITQYLGNVPGDSSGWGKLAEAYILSGTPNEAAPALKMSMLTGPWIPSFLLWRSEVGLGLLPFLDDEGRDLLVGQLATSLERTSAPFMEMVRLRGARETVHSLLAQRPQDAEKFESLLAAGY